MTATQTQSKIRYAVIGLGWFAQEAILPAFEGAENSELVALVSDDPTKLEELSQKYPTVKRTFSYEEFSYEAYDDLLASGAIDAVYIALPNHLHCEYTVRAAKAGVHVLCEKPMAVTVEECDKMIEAAKSNNVKLAIAYRLHLEEANIKAVETVKSGKIGNARVFNSVFSQQVEKGNVRVEYEPDKGGGTLYDIGIYCINAARYIFQAEPIEVFATSANNGEERFSKVEEMSSVIMRFPEDKLAAFTCSFGVEKVSNYQVIGTKGDLFLKPAYASQGEIKHLLTVDGKTQEKTFGGNDQVAAELVYFSNCVLQNKEPEISGIEGKIDVQIIRALYDSIESGKFVQLDLPQRDRRPSQEQKIEVPANSQEPDLINAADPSGES